MKNFERVNTEPGYDHCGRINFMCQSGGYVMVKRARAVPFVLARAGIRYRNPYQTRHTPRSRNARLPNPALAAQPEGCAARDQRTSPRTTADR